MEQIGIKESVKEKGCCDLVDEEEDLQRVLVASVFKSIDYTSDNDSLNK